MFLKQIFLKNGTAVFDTEKTGICKSCGKKFKWYQTLNKKFMPVEEEAPDVFVSHFATCPGAGKHRRKKNVRLPDKR